MSQNMLGSLPLSAIQGPRDDFEQKLAGKDGKLWLKQFNRFLRKEACWPDGQATPVAKVEPASSILEFVMTVAVPATSTKFVARKGFVIGTGHKVLVKISYLGDNFTAWFLADRGKIEEPLPKQMLRYHRLRQSSLDAPIIAELDGEEKAETTLSELFSLMKKQKNGQDGVLLVNGWWNIFYVRDTQGVLRAVRVHWGVGGWGVRAGSVEYPHSWFAGYQVFSRNSVCPVTV